MLDFMAQLDQELEIGDHAFREGAFRVLQAIAQFPVSVGTALGCHDLFGAIDAPDISVVDAEAAEIRMVQIGPSDDCGDDEQLGTKVQTGAIEGMNGGDHRFTRIDKKLISTKAKPSLGVYIGPGGEKLG